MTTEAKRREPWRSVDCRLTEQRNQMGSTSIDCLQQTNINVNNSVYRIALFAEKKNGLVVCRQKVWDLI
jgi:hypothetical protein